MQKGEGMKGLIMEGGAMRGMFTAGVIDVLMEEGLDRAFDGAIGVSAGAAYGCNIKSRQIGRAIRYNKRYCRDWHYASVRSLLLTGDLFNVKFCYHTIPEELDPFDEETYVKNPLKFYVTVTDVESGRPVYHCIDDPADNYLEWLEATASMPVAAKIKEIGGRKFLDGGISDSVPIKYFEHKGYDRNVVVLTQPKGYIKQPTGMMGLMKTRLGNYPNLLRTLFHRHIIYNRTYSYIENQEAAGKALVIRPAEKLPINHISHDPEELEAVYQTGRAETLRRLEDLRNFLQEKGKFDGRSGGLA